MPVATTLNVTLAPTLTDWLAGGVVIADPLGGRRRMSREAFLVRWQGTSIRAR